MSEKILRKIEELAEKAKERPISQRLYYICKTCGVKNPETVYHRRVERDGSPFEEYGWRCKLCGGVVREVSKTRFVRDEEAYKQLIKLLNSLPKPVRIGEKKWRVEDAIVEEREHEYYDDLAGARVKRKYYHCSIHGPWKCIHLIACLYTVNPDKLSSYGISIS